MTKAELLEAIKDMPDNAKVEFFHYDLLTGYATVNKAEYNEETDTITLYR